ncbi:ABC transporter permease [Mycoplasmatota bacterium]|nr:ABC transporter permease [Mycoplasmatota bacterium]
MKKNVDKTNLDNQELNNSIQETKEEICVDKIITPGQLVMKRFIRNKLAIIGIVVLVCMFVFSFFGPLLINYSYSEVFVDDELSLIRMFERPSAEHLLGLDGHGMDVMVRLMYGGRISLTVGFVVVGIEILIGTIVGGIAGFYGRWVDGLCMRIVDIFLCIPYLPVMLIVGAVIDTLEIDKTKNIYILMIMMGVLYWPGVARLIRGQILTLREQEFMVATEALGLKARRRIFKHLIPNIIPQLIVYATMGLGGIILTEAALSFLGFGVRYPVPSWGNMINAVNQPYILKQYLFPWVPPGLCIFLTVLAFNFVGDGLRDAFDPKMKR